MNSRIHKTNALFQEIEQTKVKITTKLAQTEKDVEQVENNLPQADPITKKMLKRSTKRMVNYAQRLEHMSKTRNAFLSDLNEGEINNIYERLLSHQTALQKNEPFDAKSVRLPVTQVNNIRADIKKADQIRKATKKKIRTTFQRLKSWARPWKKKAPKDQVQSDKTLRLEVFARAAPQREKAANDLEERACQIEIIKIILQDADPKETLPGPRRNLQANLSGIRSQQKALKTVQANFQSGTQGIADVEDMLTRANDGIQNADKGIAYALKNSPIVTKKPATDDFKNFVTGYLEQKANEVSRATQKLYYAQDTLKRVQQTENIKECTAKAPQYDPHSTTSEATALHNMIQKSKQWRANKTYITEIDKILKNANQVIDMCDACLKDTDTLRYKERPEMARQNQMHDTQDDPQQHAHAPLGTVVDPKENLAGQEMQAVSKAQ